MTDSPTIDLTERPAAAGSADLVPVVVSWRSWLVAIRVWVGPVADLLVAVVFRWRVAGRGHLHLFLSSKGVPVRASGCRRGPLWNNRVGHGYPVVGESQTGLFYPFHVLYAVLDVSTAYNAVQLGHYLLAFLFTWRFARQLGLGDGARVVGRIGLRLGVVPAPNRARVGDPGWHLVAGGVVGDQTIPAAAALSRAGMLAAILAVQMLAGHFHLAFITQLVLVLQFRRGCGGRGEDCPGDRRRRAGGCWWHRV
ncbi:MAG: hypothetical protein Ct9H300mP1_38500 [Planctomycetaceae bacterium]|nr:MAG: hypothetical protein Ct9H300mP1_38500 [Planctomycetaceae bacterium]